MKSLKFTSVALVVLAMAAAQVSRADGSGTGGSPAPVISPSPTSPFPAPQLVRIVSDDLFAPPGFDDNDNVQVVVHSQLINTCYKAAPPIANLDRQQHLITVAPQAYLYEGSWCLEVMIPVTQVVELGPLAAGQYQVNELDKSGKLVLTSTLPVAVSTTASPDDFLYAPVKQAKIDFTAAGPGHTVILSGAFPSDCLEMQEVKVLHRVPNIVEVLPIAAYKTGSTCQPNSRPFDIAVKLPELTPGVDTLIYVRSLNGQAVSLVESF